MYVRRQGKTSLRYYRSRSAPVGVVHFSTRAKILRFSIFRWKQETSTYWCYQSKAFVASFPTHFQRYDVHHLLVHMAKLSQNHQYSAISHNGILHIPPSLVDSYIRFLMGYTFLSDLESAESQGHFDTRNLYTVIQVSHCTNRQQGSDPIAPHGMVLHHWKQMLDNS